MTGYDGDPGAQDGVCNFLVNRCSGAEASVFRAAGGLPTS